MGLKESAGGGFADDLTEVVDVPGAADETVGEGAEIFDGKGLAFGSLRQGAAEKGQDGKNPCNRETPADSPRRRFHKELLSKGEREGKARLHVAQAFPPTGRRAIAFRSAPQETGDESRRSSGVASVRRLTKADRASIGSECASPAWECVLGIGTGQEQKSLRRSVF